MKTKQFIFEMIVALYYVYNLVYAFVFWGFWHGILNITFPYAMVADFIKSFGRI